MALLYTLVFKLVGNLISSTKDENGYSIYIFPA